MGDNPISGRSHLEASAWNLRQSPWTPEGRTESGFAATWIKRPARLQGTEQMELLGIEVLERPQVRAESCSGRWPPRTPRRARSPDSRALDAKLTLTGRQA